MGSFYFLHNVVYSLHADKCSDIVIRNSKGSMQMNIAQDVTVQVRVYLFGRFSVQIRQAGDTWREISAEEWGHCSYARCLLKVLLCSPQRAAERGTLLARIWPNAESDASLCKLLNNAAYHLHVALQDQGNLLKKVGSRGNTGYELADQALIWTDVDACEGLLQKAESLSDDLPLLRETLQEAATYFARGPFLAQEEHVWCYGRRADLARKDYRCRMQLAEVCARLGQFGQAEEMYNALLAENPSAEEVLEQLMRLYHRQGLPHLAWRCYLDARALVEKDEGLPLSPTLEELAQQLRHSSSESLLALPVPAHELVGAQVIGQAGQPSEKQSLDLQRRSFLQNALSLAGASFLTLDPFGTHADLLLRLTHALRKPSHVDAVALDGLEQRLTLYWQYRSQSGNRDLLASVEEYLYKVTSLLESSLLPDVRDRLCLIATHAALLMGTLVYDLGQHAQARRCYKLALDAARQAQNDDLQALVLGWMTFSWTYSDQPQQALIYAQKGRALANKGHDVVLQSWLASIEAEIQALLHNKDACFQALSQAEKMESASLHPNRYALFHTFDDSLFNGYKGACLKRLYDSGDPQSHLLLEQAQRVLRTAIATRPRANNLIDFAWTLAQQKELEEACRYAGASLEFIQRRQSHTSFQRLLALRRDLDPWSELAAVKDLDEHIKLLRL